MTYESALDRKPISRDRRSVAESATDPKERGWQPAGVNALRQRVGNHGIQRLMGEMFSNSHRLLRAPSIQAKLTVSEPGDAHEQEAARVANAVMRMPAPAQAGQQAPAVSETTTGIPKVQRLCAECDDELSKKAQGVQVQRKEQVAGVPLVDPSAAANIQALRGAGRALPASTRAFFEPRFGADFSNVRVHTGTRAEQAAESIDAKAFTLGRDIGFGKGQYSPESREGRTLLAHELTHVAQQAGADGMHAPIQRKVDEESFVKSGGKIEEIGNTKDGGGGEGTAESNEFMLWNYQVGHPEPRTEHTKYLKDKVLTSTRWPALLRSDAGLKVAIVGGASSTGGAAVTSPLSVARADKIKTILVSGGIDAERIVSSGVGSRRPFADETSSENMARNRRVEVFLFRPTKRVTSQSGVSVTVTNLSASVEVGFDRDTSDPKLLNLRWRPFKFDADVQVTGPANMTVGILQFLRSDSRIGTYQSPGATSIFSLDYSRCMQPELPCKDVGESMGRFSGSGRLNGPGAGKVSMSDVPGFVMPIRVSDPKSATLLKTHWVMEFVAVLGAQVGENFLPVRSVVWRLENDHALDSSGKLKPTKTEATGDTPTNGAPADLAIEKAMAGRTCRFMTRRMVRGYCRPELV